MYTGTDGQQDGMEVGEVPCFPGAEGIRGFTAEMTLTMKDGERVESRQGPKAGRAWKLRKGVMEFGERDGG